MSTLTYSNSELAPAAPAATGTETAPRNGFWSRVFQALVASQQRRADREIALYLQSHGGLMTDDMEREIMSRLGGRSKTL